MRRCPVCGKEMTYHTFGHKVYWICPACGHEMVTPRTAEVIMGTL